MAKARNFHVAKISCSTVFCCVLVGWDLQWLHSLCAHKVGHPVVLWASSNLPSYERLSILIQLKTAHTNSLNRLHYKNLAVAKVNIMAQEPTGLERNNIYPRFHCSTTQFPIPTGKNFLCQLKYYRVLWNIKFMHHWGCCSPTQPLSYWFKMDWPICGFYEILMIKILMVLASITLK